MGLELEPARAHRMLKTFVKSGFLKQTVNRHYEVGPAAFYFAMKTLHDSHVLQAALPSLERLRAANRFKVAFGVVWKNTVSYLYHARPRDALEKAIGGCGIYDATDSGIGLAVMAQQSNATIEEAFAGLEIPNFQGGLASLLQFIEEVRVKNYAFIEVAGGLSHTLAVPLAENHSMAIAFAGSISEDEIPDLLQQLRLAAREIDFRLQPVGSGQNFRQRRALETI